MPFQSEKQRKYLWLNHPEIAKRWAAKYGSKPLRAQAIKKVKEQRGKNPRTTN